MCEPWTCRFKAAATFDCHPVGSGLLACRRPFGRRKRRLIACGWRCLPFYRSEVCRRGAGSPARQSCRRARFQAGLRIARQKPLSVGVTFHYLDRGSGRSCLVLHHGRQRNSFKRTHRKECARSEPADRPNGNTVPAAGILRSKSHMEADRSV